MQFQKKTRAGNVGAFGKFFVKIILILAVVYLEVILVDKIDFPFQNKVIKQQ